VERGVRVVRSGARPEKRRERYAARLFSPATFRVARGVRLRRSRAVKIVLAVRQFNGLHNPTIVAPVRGGLPSDYYSCRNCPPPSRRTGSIVSPRHHHTAPDDHRCNHVRRNRLTAWSLLDRGGPAVVSCPNVCGSMHARTRRRDVLARDYANRVRGKTGGVRELSFFVRNDFGSFVPRSINGGACCCRTRVTRYVTIY